MGVSGRPGRGWGNFPWVTRGSLWYNGLVVERQGGDELCPGWGGASGRHFLCRTHTPAIRQPGRHTTPKLPQLVMILKKIAFIGPFRGAALILLFLLLLTPAGVSPVQAQPRVEVPVTVHDFGQVREDMALNYPFIVRNTGDQDLKILEVDPDCDCTVPHYDRVIPPGQEGKINLELKPFSVVNAFKKVTTIRFNDPRQKSVKLVLKGEAAKSLEILPSHIVRLRGAPEDKLTAQVRFISHLPFPWEITKFENSIPEKIEVSLKTEKPGKEYVIEVKNKSTAQERYVGRIEVFTNAANKPKIVLRVIADLYPDSGFRP
jgi:hypothetical protein